ncbi:hypothetical protein AX17_002807 [Amanita inopinata Kibby_2008]|nr:hypothetical protein AX17_002807 [Amanita inopinata Kibby_2008]
MFTNTKLFFLAALLAGVNAQSYPMESPMASGSMMEPSMTGSGAAPTSTASIPKCVLDCVMSASTPDCQSFTDPCVCTSMAFQQAAGQCLTSKCSQADQQAAMQLQQQVCGATATTMSGGSESASMTMPTEMSSAPVSSAPASSAPASSAAVSTSAASSASASSSSAALGKVSFGQTGLLALGVSVAGAVIGGMML